MDKLDNLKKLKSLLESNVITESEYSKMKEEILNPSTPDVVSKKTEVPKKEGVMTVSFAGQFALIDMKVHLYINEQFHSTQSYRKGFSVKVPLTVDKLQVEVKNISITGTNSTIYEFEDFEQGRDYLLELSFDALSSRFHKDFNLS